MSPLLFKSRLESSGDGKLKLKLICCYTSLWTRHVKNHSIHLQ